MRSRGPGSPPPAILRTASWLAALLLLTAGCSVQTPAATQAPTPTATAVAPQPTPVASLTVTIDYPTAQTELEMGQLLRFIVQAVDARGNAAVDAQMSITLRDPAGKVVATIPAKADDQGTFRTEPWPLPHRVAEGAWSAAVEATSSSARGAGQRSFVVKNSTSEVLLNKYGFWLDEPAFNGIAPGLYAEQGDARNGMILWGGARTAQHVFVEGWVQLNWREGDAGLTSAEAVRRFVLDKIGDLAMTPVRSIGPISPMRFRQWDAWKVEGRGQFLQDHVEWVAFYAPEANRTVLLGTRVVVPPVGIDAHARLRDDFAFVPEIRASGTAPQTLPQLLPRPELLSPPLGAQFEGVDQPVVLSWKAVKPLAADEYYEVDVDYNYKETNSLVRLTTRDTTLTLPVSLYQTPNCQVFNWQVTLKRQTGTDEAGQPEGQAISYTSLYGYIQWFHPVGQAPFVVACPNAQY